MNARVPSRFLRCPSLLCLPRPPFLVQPYLSRYPPDQWESIFVVVPLALSLSVPPGLGPVDFLTAVLDPFHVHPPPSYAMLVGHSLLSLNRHIAVVVRSVTTPRHGRGHGPRLPRLLGAGPVYQMCCNAILNNGLPPPYILLHWPQNHRL